VSIVGEERANVLIVPAAAIAREENKTTVFVVGADGKAHRHEVVTGLASNEGVQFVSGVSEGDKVVVKGQDELPDGATVTVEEAEGEEEKPGKEPGKEEEPAPPSARP
jgi:multidrug efflux pump subunit AcrA (membrane-fusion protein)